MDTFAGIMMTRTDTHKKKSRDVERNEKEQRNQ